MSQETSEYVSQLTRFWTSHDASHGTCRSASFVGLWFVNLWTLTALAVLTLGRTELRTYIHQFINIPFPADTTPSAKRIVSTFGSLAIQVLSTVVTSAILRANLTFSHSLLIWFSRPLPATAIAAVSHLGCQLSYEEYQITERLYGIGALALYGSLWTTAFNPPPAAKTFLAASKFQEHSLQMMRAGIVLGMLFTICSLALVCAVTPGARNRLSSWLGVFPNHLRPKNLLRGLMICNAMRMMAAFLIWSGALRLNKAAFCPTARNIVSVTMLWAFVPVAELLWRAAFACPDISLDDLTPPRTADACLVRDRLS